MDAIQEKVIDKMTNDETEDEDFKEKNTKPVTAKASKKTAAKDTKLKKRDKSKDKPNNKPKEKKFSNIDLMKSLLKARTKDEEIVKTFIKRYKEKGVTDKDFIAKRIAIYKKIASA